MHKEEIILEMNIYSPKLGKSYLVKNVIIMDIEDEVFTQDGIEVIFVKDAPKIDSKIIVNNIIRK